MVAYSFKARFAAPILAGTKRQTIRADRKRHARPGEELQLYTGMRTKHCKLIGRATCVAVSDVKIEFKRPSICVFSVAGIRPHSMPHERDRFARADGFADFADMQAFWTQEHPGVDVFEGLLIQWGELA